MKKSPLKILFCLYVLLYEQDAVGELQKAIEWIRSSGKAYFIDVYGVSEDLARLFCISESEKHDLIFRNEEMRNHTISSCRQLIEWKNEEKLTHFLLIQDCNTTGLGVDLDKTALIHIFGE